MSTLAVSSLNNLKFAFRSLKRFGLHSFLNLVGLALGLTTSLFIFHYVKNEKSYDSFHLNKSKIYRLTLDHYNQGALTAKWAAGSAGIGPALKQNFPEVERFVKMHKGQTINNGNKILEFEGKVHREEKTYFASEDFFEMFSFRLKEGVRSKVLKDPFSIVLSESSAKKYFGERNPIGKVLTLNGKHSLVVTGVFEDVPANSHMHFDMLISFETFAILSNYPRAAHNDWHWYGFYTFVQLDESASAGLLEAKIPTFIEQTIGEDLNKFSRKLIFHLQPLTTIHLHSDLFYEFHENGNGKTVTILAIFGSFILILAWINYLNLTNSQTIERAREIGMRKILGSHKKHLIAQFLTEAGLTNFLAVFLSIGLGLLLLPYFNQISGYDVSFTSFLQASYGGILVLFLVGSTLGGIFPAILLKLIKPRMVLQGQFTGSLQGRRVKNGLVIFQFAIATALMIGTVIIYSQIKFMLSQELGIDINKTIAVKGPITDQDYNQKLEAFKARLVSMSGVKVVSASSAVPGAAPASAAGGVRRIQDDNTKSKQYQLIDIDYTYLNNYGLSCMIGRGFSYDFSDENSVLLNEAGIHHLGLPIGEDVIGEKIFIWGDTLSIIGVIKNHHHQSLKSRFEPTIFRLRPNNSRYYSIKFNASVISAELKKVKEIYLSSFPGNPFEYFFVDQYYDKQNETDRVFGKLSFLFTIVAILISCLGLYSLSSWLILRKRKEIAIKKVLGATIENVLLEFFNRTMLLIVPASLIGCIVAWFTSNQWLNDFAFHITLSAQFFIIPVVVSMILSIITIAYDSIKVAITNPVKSIREL